MFAHKVRRTPYFLHTLSPLSFPPAVHSLTRCPNRIQRLHPVQVVIAAWEEKTQPESSAALGSKREAGRAPGSKAQSHHPQQAAKRRHNGSTERPPRQNKAGWCPGVLQLAASQGVPCVSSCSSLLSSSASSRGSYLMSCTRDSRMSISSFKSCRAEKKKKKEFRTLTSSAGF